MNKLTLKQLRYFERLALHRHFGRAAEACSISQPALSMQIREMEATLGAALFERDARQLRLTAFGEQLALRCREILCSVDELEELARASHESLSGRLRIGIIPTIAPYLLPLVIAKFALEYPDLDLHIRETQTAKLLQELRDGHLDTAIVALPVSESTLEEVALFDECFVLVRHASEAGKPVPNLDALGRMRLLLLEEGHCFRDQALEFCNRRATLPRESLDGSSLSTLVQMVGAGIGVTLIPEMAVGVETHSANVSLARFGDPQPTRTIGMIWRKTNPLASHFTKLSDTVRRAGKTR
jgi:LysR family hydrogen peroxide-inducible transcriptional activator